MGQKHGLSFRIFLPQMTFQLFQGRYFPVETAEIGDLRLITGDHQFPAIFLKGYRLIIQNLHAVFPEPVDKMLVNRPEILRRLIAALVVSVAEKHRIFRCELLKKREGLPVDAGLSHDHIATHDHQIRICLINRLQKAFLVFPVKAAVKIA